MKRLFVHPDGRLRSGPVSVLAFLLVLGLAEVVFEVKTRSEQELVRIRHVFKETTPEVVLPEEVVPEQEVVEPSAEEPVPVEVEPMVPPKTESEVELEPERELVPAIKEEMPPPPAPSPTRLEPSVGQQTPPPVAQKTTLSEEGASVPVEPNPLLALLGEKELVEDKTGQREFEISDELRALAEARKRDEVPPLATSEDLFVASIPKGEPVQKKIESRATVVSDTEVRLPSHEYNDIFKSWRNAGTEDKGQEQLSFRVQDLRQNYKLLQMRPVVVRNKRYTDLFDGSPLPEEMLQEYSSLQLVVERPWQEWRMELQQLSIRPGEEFNIRYLLYGSIDRAMQNRVNRAFECGREIGLIPPDTEAGAVEVVGRVIQVSREGGGHFGIFMPETLRLDDAPLLSVPGRCFAGSRDVQMLMDAGVVKY